MLFKKFRVKKLPGEGNSFLNRTYMPMSYLLYQYLNLHDWQHFSIENKKIIISKTI